MKRFLPVIISLFTIECSFCQDLASSLLWKISGNELDTPSYIFGTVHLICPDEMQIFESLKEAFDKTEVMLMEIDMDDPNLAIQMQQYSFNDDNSNILDELSEEDAEIMNKFLIDNFNTELSQIGIFRPLVISSMVSMKLLPCPKVASFEIELVKMASVSNKEIKGLETVRDQMSIFDSIPQSQQILWLLETIKDMDNSKKEFAELIKVYLEQDVDKIYEYTMKFPEYKEYEDLFITDRNRKWVPVIERQIKNKPTFIAVGAGHLGSETGVVNLLMEKGYVIEPIYLE